MERNVFFYDGNCSFCTVLAFKLQRLCIAKNIEFLSFRGMDKEQLKKIHPTLSEEVLHGNVQFVFKGVRYPGFFGVRKLVFYLRIYRYFFFLLYLPLVPLIGIMVMNYLKRRTAH